MKRIYLNEGWIFYKTWKDDCLRFSAAEQGEKVRLPHTVSVLPYNYADPQKYQTVCGYVRMLAIPGCFRGKKIFLTFEGIAHDAAVYVNGICAAQHHCGYTAFSVEISEYVNYDCENRIAVRVDSREALPIPPFGGAVDYLTFGGIYRDVYLEVKHSVHVEDVFVRTKNNMRSQRGLHGAASAALSVRFSKDTVQLLTQGRGTGWQVQMAVFDDQDNCLAMSVQSLAAALPNAEAELRTGMRARTTTVQMRLPEVDYWDICQPRLYFAEVTLCAEKNCIVDAYRVRFGFRDVEFDSDGCWLNGRRVKLVGLNRHQSYPYVGYAMPRSMQRLDAELLKDELGCNAVRTSHYPQSQHFIDRCDELGLLVFTEIPGWQHIGGPKWQATAKNNVREMIAQYRNHPSVILWGVRINESSDNDDLYAQTNAMAHRMDPTRPTGGVRCLKNSSLLEDVYTYNDFSHTGNNPGLLPKKKVMRFSGRPYIVSEYNGHMYPTKMFDDEGHRLEHALRHANVLESLFSDSTIAGGFGWCMFDYQTHYNFGSGDGICYHGVMDMFRNPKLAAAVYRSQGEEPVCELSSTMSIGDYPGAMPGNLWVFTNADFVRVYMNGQYVGEFYPNRTKYGHLPHPPIEIDRRRLFAAGDNWGMASAVYRIDAMRGGKLMCRRIRRPVQSPYLDVWCSHTVLVEAHSYDTALIRIRAVDSQGMTLPYYNEPVRIKVFGSIERIGPEAVSLKGGCGGTYVRTLGRAGNAKVTIFAEGMEPVEIYMTVRKEAQDGSWFI